MDFFISQIVVPVNKISSDELLLLEGYFLLGRENIYYRKNNDEYITIFESGIETFLYNEKEYKIANIFDKYCLFTSFETEYYGYEFSSAIGLNNAIESIERKIKANLLKKVDLREAIEKLVNNNTVLTVEDSYAVGNCEIGTNLFIEKHFNGKNTLPLKEETKEYILKLAKENNSFARVLKNKSLL